VVAFKLLEAYSKLLRQQNLLPAFTVQGNVNSLYRPYNLLLALPIDAVIQSKRSLAYFLNNKVNLKLITNSKLSKIIRLTVNNHKNKLCLVKDIVEIKLLASKEILESIMSKTKLASKIKAASHVSVVHANFIIGNEHFSLLNWSYTTKHAKSMP
jgi:hypothetical protein